MRLILAHPEVGYRRCEDCKKWSYNAQTGEVNEQWQTIGGERTRVPVPLRGRTPCLTCPKCKDMPVRNPETGARSELSERNWRALRFYFENKSAGGMIDAIARKNCGIIQCLMDQYAIGSNRAVCELLKTRMTW